MLVAFLMYSQYIRRLLEFGLPSPDMRPSMFISVGKIINNELLDSAADKHRSSSVHFLGHHWPR